jgi:hypothetical protein
VAGQRDKGWFPPGEVLLPEQVRCRFSS